MTFPGSGLATDHYQLTMMQGYLATGLNGHDACFDLFFRSNPFNGGYTLTAGLDEALMFLEELRFHPDDIEYLAELGLFKPEFLKYLESFRFTGDVFAVPEGAVMFPMEPVVRVIAKLDQCQLVESALLNIINFQSLIATKAARVCHEAGEDNVLEFGLRRAQGHDGALTAARAAYIGGCAATSNVEAGKVYGIPVRGTHAHSWVTAFPDEITAFRKFVELYPDNSILLVDTYDTLNSGVPAAIQVGLEMRRNGRKLGGIRLDSGDLAFLSIRTRKMLDEAGLVDTMIVCSSELDEFIIHDLNSQGARIDIFGVGTKLISANGDPALSGVYKMAAIREQGGQWRNTIKKTEGLKKATLPGVKQVWRLLDSDNEMMGDIIELEDEKPDFSAGIQGVHPFLKDIGKIYDGIKSAGQLLAPSMVNGRRLAESPSLRQIRARAKKELDRLHPTTRRLLNPHEYKVSVGPQLNELTQKL